MATSAQTNPLPRPLAEPRRGAGQTLRNALIITRREVRDSFRDWRIIAPIVIMTLAFPAISQFGANLMMGFVVQYGGELIGERTIPFLLMVVGFFPISLSLVIALETFVGEKERMSLEPLLSTPLTNLELYIGKTLSAMIPPLLSSYGGMAVYLVSLLFGHLAWRPEPMLIVQIILLTTAQALLMVTGAVVVSSQTTSTRAANLLASFIIVPMSLLVIAESIIMFSAPDADSPNGIFALWVLLVGQIVATVLFLRMGAAIFNREELLGRTLDRLNLRWAWGIFWDNIRGKDRPGLFGWYRREVLTVPRKLGRPLLVIGLCMVAAWIVGTVMAQNPNFQIPQQVLTENEMLDNFQVVYDMGSSGSTVLAVLWQNSRTLILASALATISFGVMAVVIGMVPFAVMGWALYQFQLLGLGFPVFLAAVVPHGLLEVPAIILMVAVSLRLGAIITKPQQGMTITEAWLGAVADLVKVGVGLVLPLLIAAAIVEVYITPLVMLAVVGG